MTLQSIKYYLREYSGIRKDKFKKNKKKNRVSTTKQDSYAQKSLGWVVVFSLSWNSVFFSLSVFDIWQIY